VLAFEMLKIALGEVNLAHLSSSQGDWRIERESPEPSPPLGSKWLYE
jgi:hypothetical protein